jgi:subtilase family serine protease
MGLGSEYLTNDYVFSLATIVHNDGDAAAGSFQIGFYLSQDQYFDSGFDTLIATGDISSLSAGYYTISSGQIALPAGIPGGFYYISAIADDQNAVSESDETDNGWYFGQVRINQYEDPGVDLAMFSLDTSGYHSAYTSTISFPMEFTGINDSIGDVNSGTCYLSTYLADDTFTLLGAPTELDWSYKDCLASPWLGYDSGVFYLVTATQEANITNVSASPGLHFLYTWIDDELQISETNDDNNMMLWPIVLQ